MKSQHINDHISESTPEMIEVCFVDHNGITYPMDLITREAAEEIISGIDWDKMLRGMSRLADSEYRMEVKLNLEIGFI